MPSFGTTRNVALGARNNDRHRLLQNIARSKIVLPVLITSVSTVSHCPIWALLMKSIGHADRHQRISAPHFAAAAVPHGLVCQRCNQAAMDETRARWYAAFASPEAPG